MAILNILTAPDPRLLSTALPVDKVDSNTRKIRDDLFDTLYDKKGLGLAAVQVNILKRLIVIDLGERDGVPFKPLFMANPELLKVSTTTQVTEEACLSVPGFYGKITRSLEVDVTYLDENNQKQVLSASGLLADCIQHEIDHLNGILYINHLSSLKKNLILSKLRRNKRKQR
jgi:peptide deformylase